MAHVTASVNRLHSQQTPAAVTAKTQSARKPGSSATPSFRTLFTRVSPAVTPAATPAVAPAKPLASVPPTPELVFGASPWETNPLGRNPNGTEFSYNPIYFASPNTAAQVAQMLGGTVTENNALAASAQEQPNRMVQMPDGRMINSGLVASFYSHGYPQSYIDGLLAREINGTNA